MSTTSDVTTLANRIAGVPAPAGDGAVAEVVNPATEQVIALVPDSGAADVDAAVTAARSALPVWASTPPGERAAALLRLADRIERAAPEIAVLEADDAGKPVRAVLEEELPFTLDNLRFLAGAARALTAPAGGDYVRGTTSVMRREPVGVVAQIAPWNFPLMTLLWKLGAALATGNTVVFKPDPATPLSALRVADLAGDLLPPGALNVVCGGVGVGRAMVAHPGVDMVALTGSVEAGRAVAAEAAGTLKRVHLELGGKAPVVVFADGDVERAADAIAGAGFYNAGQQCTAATRVLADAAIHDELVEVLARRAGELVIGDPHDAATTLGPLSSERQRARVEGFLERRAPATQVVTGGGRPDRPGFFLEPTVVTGVAQEDELTQREVFGPVVTVQRFDAEDEAVAAANATEYGLVASVWTRDVGRATRVSGRLDFGTVWVNCHDLLASEAPHGGFGQSGHGKDLSIFALEEHTRIKHVMTSAE